MDHEKTEAWNADAKIVGCIGKKLDEHMLWLTLEICWGLKQDWNFKQALSKSNYRSFLRRQKMCLRINVIGKPTCK